MAVTLFRIRKVTNNIIIRNGVKKEDNIEQEKSPSQEIINAKIRGKMYARRTVNR